MTASELDAWEYELKGRGITPGLSAVAELARELGDPQEKVPVIHIAGTNAKGSVLAYISTVLKEAGYRTGRFFSPSLSEDRESIQIGLKPVSKKDYAAGMERIKEADERIRERGFRGVSFFEALTVLAYLSFAEKGCDLAVVECGMGGLEDATNIVSAPLVTVITPVAADHQAFLGRSLKEIAGNKAGIIKPGAVCVTSREQEPEVYAAIAEKAGSCGTELIVSDTPVRLKGGIRKQSFDLGERKGLKISLAGLHQSKNAALAVKALDEAAKKGFVISDGALRRGLEKTEWYGRFSVLKSRPYLIADGAHNPAGARSLAESLERYFPEEKFIFIIGVLKDKAYEEMLDIWCPLAEYIICITPPENSRALQAMELAEEAAARGVNVTTADSVEEGLEEALLLSGGQKHIIACGSLSWLEKLRREVLKNGR